MILNLAIEDTLSIITFDAIIDIQNTNNWIFLWAGGLDIGTQLAGSKGYLKFRFWQR
jgi:hypothetical protein